MTTRRSRQAGFTLVELMISLVLFSFAVAGVLAVAVSMSQGFREQRAAMGAEGAVRVPLDFIADALRQSSPGAPTGNIQDLVACTNTVLAVSNNQTSINTPFITGWDKLDVIFASGAVVTSTLDPYDPAVSNTVHVNDASQLVAGDSVVISNLGQGHLLKLASVAGNALTFVAPACAWTPPQGGTYTMGSFIIRAQHAIFTIDSVDGIPTLMMDPDAGGPAVPEPLAEGVEDLQIALGVDSNPPLVPDGKLGTIPWVAGTFEDSTGPNLDEWQGNNAGDGVLSGPVRAVRVTLVARTTTGLVGNKTPFVRPAVEDHAASGTPDKFRRRILRSIVEIRNMAGSP
jgi:prepilin-type N-terminal cleavage/methylation domain-containing protein